MRSDSRATWIASTLLACSIFLSAAPASASGTLEPLSDRDEQHLASLALTFSLVGFLSADLAFALSDRPMPIWLSILQMTVGGVAVPLLVVGAGIPTLSVIAVISGVWFIGHGIYSIDAYSDYRVTSHRELRRRKAEEEERRAEARRAYLDGLSGSPP